MKCALITVAALVAFCAAEARRVRIMPQSLMEDPAFADDFSDDRIVGGMIVKPYSHPYQISVQTSGHGSHFCGGSIISSKLVLTAAHCVSDTTPDRIRVVGGEHNLEIQEGPEQVRSVSRIIVHPKYSDRTLRNDIAILVIRGKFNFNSKVKYINLPNRFETFRKSAVVTGWGTLRSGGRLPDRLRKVRVPIVSERTCKNAYGSTEIADSMLCAGAEGKDSCQGDSGGPLMCDEKKGRRVLCGVVSWGKGCALRGFPGVYTEVSYFIDWINRYKNAYQDDVFPGTKPVPIIEEKDDDNDKKN